MDNLIEKISKKSKSAFEVISTSSIEKRNSAILNISKLLEERSRGILDANKSDLENAKKKNLTPSFIDRLTLNESRIKNMLRLFDPLPHLR